MSYSNVPDLEDTSDRQAALRRYHILDTDPEKNFDRITSLVAKVCEVPTALITLIDEERQWFKSCFGFDARETDIGVSFCVHAVHQGETLVVEDATEDPRFKDNPIVTGPPHIRFYAGAPLTTPEGIHIGTLCIIDYEARTFDAAQREILDRLADVVVNQFELRSAEAQVRQLVDQNPQPMYVYAQSDGRVLHANAAARDLYGYEESALSSLTAEDLAAPAADQPSSDDLSMHKREDGSFFPVRLREREVLFNGRAATLAVPQSVSERHDTDTTIFFQTDLEGTTQSLSAEWEATTGFSIADTVGGDLLDFVHPLDRSATDDVFSSLLNGEMDTCQHEANFLTQDGSQSFELHARLVRDESGAPTGATGTLTPIIEQETPSVEPATESTSPPPAEESDPAPTEAETPTPPESSDDADTTTSPAPTSTDEDASSPDSPAAPTSEDESAENADESPDEPEPESASDETDSDLQENSVFSTELPSFAENEPSSPSAPINGPVDEEPSTEAESNDEPELTPEPFDLVETIEALLDEHEPALRRQDVALRRSLPSTSLPVRLDPQAVRDVVRTLINEADPVPNSTVIVRVATGDDEVRVSVAVPTSTDASAPSDDDDLPRSLVGAMEGTLDVEDDGDETQFTVTLPRSTAPSGDGSASILSSESPTG